MTKMNARFLPSFTAVAVLFSLTLSTFAQTVSKDYPLQEDLPHWAQDGIYEVDHGMFLDIENMMKVEGISRAAAVEVQGEWKMKIQARKLTNRVSDRAALLQVYKTVLAEVKNDLAKNEKFSLTGWAPINWAAEEAKNPGAFVAVFDMDETLLQQWQSVDSNKRAKGKPELTGVEKDFTIIGGKDTLSRGDIKFTPNVEAALLRLKNSSDCKGIVFFSAKVDVAAIDIVNKWDAVAQIKQKLGEKFLGLYVRSHLLVGKGARLPSKDLRIFDESLKHVVMIDDNPGRIFQPKVLRAQPIFDADIFSGSRDGGTVDQYYRAILDQAVTEILDSAQAARLSAARPAQPAFPFDPVKGSRLRNLEGQKFRMTFGDAFLPYSYAGVRVFEAARKNLLTKGVTGANAEQQAATFVRDNFLLTGTGQEGFATFDFAP